MTVHTASSIDTAPIDTAVPYVLRRLGVVMTPDLANPHEIEGVLNPGSGRDPAGQLYLLPRIVAAGNVSRVGLARVDDRVQIGGDEQRRQRVDRTDTGGRHRQRLDTQLAHRLIEMAATSWFPR